MRTLLVVAVALLVMLGVAPAVDAQDATPAGDGPTADASLLAGLGYPDLVVATDGATFTVPDEVAAGRYRLVVENSSSEAATDVEFYQPPAGATTEEVLAMFAAAAGTDEVPDLFYRLTTSGGATAQAGGTGEALVDLTPGEWVVILEVLDPTGGSHASPGTVIDVTGEMPSLADPPADVEVTMVEMAFEMPATVPVGPHVWKLTNAGAAPHFMLIGSYPAPVTAEQVQATMNTLIGTPPASPEALLNPDELVPVVESAVLSAGRSTWVEVDLEAGQHLVFCFLSGPGELPIHAAMGMFKIVTVA